MLHGRGVDATSPERSGRASLDWERPCGAADDHAVWGRPWGRCCSHGGLGPAPLLDAGPGVLHGAEHGSRAVQARLLGLPEGLEVRCRRTVGAMGKGQMTRAEVSRIALPNREGLAVVGGPRWDWSGATAGCHTRRAVALRAALPVPMQSALDAAPTCSHQHKRSEHSPTSHDMP